MSDAQIEQIEAIDKKIFRNDMNYDNHNIPMYSGYYAYDENNIELESVFTPLKNMCEEMDYSLSGRYYWIDEISSDVLLNEIHKLNAFEIEVITLVAFDGYSKNETAKKLNISYDKVQYCFKKIQNRLKNKICTFEESVGNE